MKHILTGYFIVTGKRENIADKTKKYFQERIKEDIKNICGNNIFKVSEIILTRGKNEFEVHFEIEFEQEINEEDKENLEILMNTALDFK